MGNVSKIVDGFKWVNNVSKIDKDFIKNYDEDGDIGYFLNVDIEYPRELHDLHSDLSFLSDRMKINRYNKLVCNFHDKENYIAWSKTKKKIHKGMAFYQEAWLKEYIYMNTELRKKADNDFKKDFFKIMNNA